MRKKGIKGKGIKGIKGIKTDVLCSEEDMSLSPHFVCH